MNMIVNIQHATIHTALPGQFEGALTELTCGAAITTAPEIGQPWPEQGGILAGIMPAQEGHPAYYLIVEASPLLKGTQQRWCSKSVSIETSAWDGLANTKKMVADENDYPAAQYCASLSVGGFNDYYLAARREASLIAATVPHLANAGWHWTSTQYSAGIACVQDFSDGNQGYYVKGNEFSVLPVRRFLIN